MTHRQYVFVKTSLDSMTRGRIAAQCAHAGSSLVFKLLKKEKSPIYGPFQDWYSSTDGGFGTTIVLNGFSLHDLYKKFNEHKWRDPVFFDEVLDPEYAIPDGHETIFVPMVTCVNLFASERDYWNFIEAYRLNQILVPALLE